MKITFVIILFHSFLFICPSSYGQDGTFKLTVVVENFRSSKGAVMVALYNKEGSIPDEHFKRYFKIEKAEIINNKLTVTFYNLSKGSYAVSVLHDENKNGKVDKGMIFPKEGIGFSNYQSINVTNRPNFKKASFELKQDEIIKIKVIYF